ncbi:MAG TPA: DUF6438 domain-containing protein [Kofleriaceae bacterium]|nr:DUF6438 domain-containing protein [Kofleriaceae bacterium]
MRALVFVLAVSCGSASPSPPAVSPRTPGAPLASAREPTHELIASLERTACFGACSIYKVTIYRDGVVEWKGKDFVDTIGPAVGQLRPGQLAQLDNLFRDNGYLELHDTYQAGHVTDRPWVHTSYSPSTGTIKRVAHYLGDRTAPPRLLRIEDGIDQIAVTGRWIGTGGALSASR